MTKELSEDKCPSCAGPLSACTDVNNPDNVTLAKPGDLTVCVYCAAVLQFDEDLKHVVADSEILENLSPDTKQALDFAVWTAREVAKSKGAN